MICLNQKTAVCLTGFVVSVNKKQDILFPEIA